MAVAEPTTLDRARRWRPTRRGLALAALLLLALAVLTLTARTRTGRLDPAAVDPQGSRAAATILGDLGVDVRDVRLTSEVAAQARGATVLVTTPGLPTTSMVEQVLAAGPSRIVLVGALPGDPALARLAAGVGAAPPAGDDPLEPGCQLRAAQQAGAARLPGTRYDAQAWQGAAHTCYDSVGSAALVVLEGRAARPEVVLLGSPEPLTNAGLDAEGNAALALNLLGGSERLLWWRPTAADPELAAGDQAPLAELVPAWVVPVVIQVAIACLLVAWWRGRRLGPLVVEPLPVVVRAGETTDGLARLLRANSARGEAAAQLRALAREGIRTRLGLPRGCPPERLVAAVAGRTGRAPGTVGDLLYGRDPQDDRQLVALGQGLESLMSEVGGA